MTDLTVWLALRGAISGWYQYQSQYLSSVLWYILISLLISIVDMLSIAILLLIILMCEKSCCISWKCSFNKLLFCNDMWVCLFKWSSIFSSERLLLCHWFKWKIRQMKIILIQQFVKENCDKFCNKNKRKILEIII